MSLTVFKCCAVPSGKYTVQVVEGRDMVQADALRRSPQSSK